jgi:hypothetical protein
LGNRRPVVFPLLQPSLRPKRWSPSCCLAEGKRENAHDLDNWWRALGHLASIDGTNDIADCND